MVSSKLLRALHLTFWFACLALLLGLLGYALFFAYAFIVLSPLLLLGAIVGGAIGHSLPDVTQYAGPLLAYLALCLLLALLSGAVSYRIWLLLRPETKVPAAGAANRVSRIRSFGAAARDSSYLPREWLAGSAFAGVALGLAAWIPLADRVVGSVAPVELLRPDSEPELAALPATEADIREFNEKLRPGATRGDAYAQWIVGEVQRNGLMGVTAFPESGAEWIGFAAEKGDPDAQLSLITGAIVGDLRKARDKSIPSPASEMARLVTYANQSTGWRRVAAELMLASGGGGRAEWFERAARDGSRYAAFMRARDIEEAVRSRDDGTSASTAYAWYAGAGAELEMLRLAAGMDASGRARAQAQADALVQSVADGLGDAGAPPPTREELERMLRRSRMVGERARAQGIDDMRSRDALAHAIVHAEARGEFASLARWFGEKPIANGRPRDPRVGIWLFSLAAGQGDVAAMVETVRLLESSQWRVPKHVEYIYAWNALAEERLQAARSEDEALIAVAIDGRDRARANLDPAGLRDAETLLAALRARVPAR